MDKFLKLAFVFWFCLLLLPEVSKAQNQGKEVLLKRGFQKYDASGYIEVIDNNKYLLEQAKKVFETKPDSLLPYRNIANFSGHNKGWWCKLIVTNNSDDPQDIVVQVGNLYIHQAMFYKSSSNFEMFAKTGVMVPEEERTDFNRFMNASLTLAPKSKDTIYMELRKSSLIKLPIRIYEKDVFEKKNQKVTFSYGIYFGFVLVLFLCSSFIAITLKRRMLYEYALYLLAFAYMVFCLGGFMHRFGITNGHWYVDFVYQDSVSLVMILMVFFAISFLNLRENLPKFARYLRFLAITYMVTYIVLKILSHLGVFETYILVLMYQQYAFIVVFFISIIAAGIANIRYNRSQSILYLMAYGSLLLIPMSAIILEFIFLSLGAYNIDFGSMYESAYMIGSTFEILFFTVGVTNYIRRIDYERIKLRDDLMDEKIQSKRKIEELKKIVEKDHIILKDRTKVYISDLIYIKADDHYLKLFLVNGKEHFVRGKLSQIKQELPTNFRQSHRSYIVNVNFIKQVNSDYIVLINKGEVPLSRTYKKLLD